LSARDSVCHAQRLEAARRSTAPDAATAIDNALKIYNEAHREYMNLPDEMAAWEACRQVQEAVRRHHELTERMATAQKELDRSDANLEEALAAGRTGPSLRALERAESRLRKLTGLLAARTGREP
jgi:multidrug resistance efflux pump